jgi:hypothetical protein
MFPWIFMHYVSQKKILCITYLTLAPNIRECNKKNMTTNEQIK